jgi:hypothetical protein
MNEQQQASDLDARISQLQAGESPQSDFAAELVQLAEDIRPDSVFAADLRARLQVSTSSNEKKEKPMKVQYHSNPLVRTLAYAAAAFAALVVLTLTVPPLRVLAQEVLDSLFNRAPADTIAFETPVVVDVNPTPIAEAIFATPGTLADVQAQVDFTLKAAAYLPEGYTFYSASVDAPGLVTLSYVRGGYMLNISQSRVADAQAFEVGATAEIQTVEINGVAAEYVEGYWFAEVNHEGDQAELRGRVWDGNGNYQQMRWQQDGIVYWMHSVIGSGTDLPLDEWVAVAESLE